MNEHFASEFQDVTTLHPLALVAVLLAGLLMLIAPRRYALWPMIAICCLVASSQRLVILGFDFTLLRVMVVFGFVRILAIEAWRPPAPSRLDFFVIVWAIGAMLLPLAKFATGEVFDTENTSFFSQVVYFAGATFDALGMYAIFRWFVRDWADAASAALGLTWALIVIAPFFAVEAMTGRNPFALFGGVPEITLERNGRMRCQGAFSHPILAGCFAASALPLVAARWWWPRASKALVVLGVAAGLLVVIASSSSTPATAVLAAGIGFALLPLRKDLRVLRWSVVLAMIALHLAMNKPVWHLIVRLTGVVGGSTWHRYSLLNGFITHAHEWWLIGSRVGSRHWGHFTHDVTNMYIQQGLSGGVIQLALFVASLAVAFGCVGRLWRGVREQDELAGRPIDRRRLVFAWMIGVALFTHAVNHFGVAYFGQVWMGYYLVLGVVGSLDALVQGERRRTFDALASDRRAFTTT